jgi:isopentenyl diphosphate isomerase/L-lactate dehydrogenase-like FMN-dependent dehydrogenase
MTKQQENLVSWLAIVVTVLLVILLAMALKAEDSPTLTEIEELKTVNIYQKAVLADVDVQRAIDRRTAAISAYNAQLDHLRDSHKWSKETTFEINAETGKVTVKLPPAPAPKVPEVQSKEKK